MTLSRGDKIAAARPTGGGAATASGMNFQAVATAIASVHLIAGTRLRWLDGIVDDTPVAVWTETSGPGDDIRLELADRSIAEAQVRRGARAGGRLWTSLVSLARAVVEGSIAHGVLVVSPDCSRNVAYNLSQGIRRIADGRTDGLDAITQTFRGKLVENGLPPTLVCTHLRVHVVHGIDGDDATVSAARALLATLVADRRSVDLAWDLLYREAAAAMERRGRLDAAAAQRLFAASGIKIADSSSPVAILTKLSHWVVQTNGVFSIPAIAKPLSIRDAWLPLQLSVRENLERVVGPAEALARYHSTRSRDRSHADLNTSDAAWVGRFHRHAVVRGGPGLGKTTLLTKVAQLYAEDGYPVLKVRLSAVAASMAKGATFAHSVFDLGLDGSGIAADHAKRLGDPEWVLLCDGLDECPDHQELIANALQRFAAGHPDTRIVVTTRPIGYDTRRLADWRHYDLLPPESNSAPDHLATLLRAALSEGHDLQRDTRAQARRELEESASSDAICGSPLLLGLAASLLVNGRHLSASKTRLYADLLTHMADLRNSRQPPTGLTDAILGRFLDVLGTSLVRAPLATLPETLERCAAVLESELPTTPLHARDLVERCQRHWEAIGLVERVHHGTDTFLTFVHRTFAEFAAARDLNTRTATEQQAAVVDYVDRVAPEVLAFASGLGLADIVVEQLAAHDGDNAIDSIEQALRVLAAPEADVAEILRRHVLEKAFEAADRLEMDRAFALGATLAHTARTAPDTLGATAAKWLKSTRFSTRLVAWTCVSAAGPRFYDAEEAAAEVRFFAGEVGPGLDLAVHGIRALQNREDHLVLAKFARALVARLLDEWPSGKVDSYVADVLASAPFHTFSFRADIGSLYDSKGRECPLPAESLGVSSDILRRLQPDSDYSRASRAASRALLVGAVGTQDLGAPTANPPRPALLLSAYLEISGFGDVPESDVWSWTASYDPAVVQEVMGTLVALARFDKRALAAEARVALEQLEDPNADPLWSSRVSLDVPEPDWSAVKALNVDWRAVARAITHPSLWLVQTAVDLFCGRGDITPDNARELLDKASGYGLAGAAHIACLLPRTTAVELLLEAIDDRKVPGMEHLFHALTRLAPAWDQRLAATVRSGLLGNDAEAAKAAAELAKDGSERREPVDPTLLDDAHRHWCLREAANLDDSMPASPRQSLLETMLTLGAVDENRLIVLCGDRRWDVAGVAADALLKRVANSALSRTRFVDALARKDLPAPILSRALAQDLPFSEADVQRLLHLSTDDDDERRLSIANLLHLPSLSADAAAEVGERLLNDPSAEVRRAARRALDRAALRRRQILNTSRSDLGAVASEDR